MARRQQIPRPTRTNLAIHAFSPHFVSLAISPDRQVLEQVGLGALWIMSLLAMLSAAEQSITPDLEQGVTDHMVRGGVPFGGR